MSPSEPGTDPDPKHPIRVVSERTGLSPDVLRAWEKRYGAVVPPRRGGAGQRLYSDADVERLRLLRKVTQAGRSIGQVAELPTEELAAMAREDESQRTAALPAPRPESRMSRGFLERAMAETRALDPAGLEQVLRRALVALRGEEFIDELAVPFLRAVGDAWEAGTLGVAHEHMSTAVLRRVLSVLADAADAEDGAPEVVVATPAAQVHELGALLAAASAAAAGWEVTFLGSDLPAEEIAGAARKRGAAAVALSIVYPTSLGELGDELRRLRRELPPWVALVVGGAGARTMAKTLEELGITFLPDLSGFRGHLARLHAGPGSPPLRGRSVGPG